MVVLGLGLIAPAFADDNNACGTVLCLAGQGGSACSKYLNPYYSIRVYDSSLLGMVFNPGKTKDARRAYLAQCSSADSNSIDAANAGGDTEFPPNGNGTGDGSHQGNSSGCRGDARCMRP
jgi:hypothetical protein